MKPEQKSGSRLARMIAAAGMLSACGLQPLLAAGDDAAMDPEAAARETWRTAMSHNTASTEGCFHASYPELVWARVDCKIAHPLVHPVHKKPAGRAEVTGNGDDYVAEAAGLITETLGTFPSVKGVKSEKSVGVAAFGGGGILGPNEYTLQVNSNYTGTTSACASHSGCTVWQQFIYSPDYNTDGEAAVFIQYWLLGWGSSACPSGGWGSDGEGDCYRNSAYVAAPDMPITDLAKLTLSGTAVAGGNDTIVFNNGSEAYTLAAKDSVVDLASVWKESEFNVVGNAGGSRADFNKGSSVTVKVALTDGSSAAPKCVANAGSTGETNNLNLGSCTTASGSAPSIEFTESN